MKANLLKKATSDHAIALQELLNEKANGLSVEEFYKILQDKRAALAKS